MLFLRKKPFEQDAVNPKLSRGAVPAGCWEPWAGTGRTGGAGVLGELSTPRMVLGKTSSLVKLLCPAQPFAHPSTGQGMPVPEPCVLSPVWWYLSHSHLLVPFWWEIYLYPQLSCQIGGSCGVVHGAG